MERESFQNETIAKILNTHFVPVKVDREERPDVDRVYMVLLLLNSCDPKEGRKGEGVDV
jgi:uncharacterized protein YyaL (SSP411 family)